MARPYWLGWGIVWAVYFTCMDAGVLFAVDGCVRVANDDFTKAGLAVGLAAFAVTAAVSCKTGSAPFARRGPAACAFFIWAATIAAVFAMPVFFNLDAGDMDALFIIAGALCSLAFAHCLLFYQSVLLGRGQAEPASMARGLLSGAVLYILFSVLPPSVAFVAIELALVLAGSMGVAGGCIPRRDDAGWRTGRRRVASLWPLLLAVCIGGYLFAQVRQVALTTQLSYNTLNLAAMIAVAFAVILYLLLVQLAPRVDPLVVLGALFIVVGALVALLPRTYNVVAIASMLGMRFAMGFAEALLFSALLNIQRKTGANATFWCALCHLMATAALSLSILPSVPGVADGLEVMQIVCITVNALCGIMVLVAVLFRKTRVRPILPEAAVTHGKAATSDGAACVDSGVPYRIGGWEATGRGAPGTLEEACSVLDGAKNLSARESEVFRLIAQGRSGPYIAEVLDLSLSTVKSHTARVYKKLGVNSRQELIDLVMAYRQR